MTEGKKLAAVINLVALVFFLIGLGLGVGAHKAAKKCFVFIPLAEAPGYIFTIDSVTYQIRPIKIRRVIYWDGKADSVYRSLLEISDRDK